MSLWEMSCSGAVIIVAITLIRALAVHPSRVAPLSGTEYVHSGEDIAAPEGAPVVAALAGTVSNAGFDAQRGNYVLLAHDEGKTSLYAHLKDVAVAQGVQVAQGDEIGTVGNSGMSTGPTSTSRCPTRTGRWRRCSPCLLWSGNTTRQKARPSPRGMGALHLDSSSLMTGAVI